MLCFRKPVSQALSRAFPAVLPIMLILLTSAAHAEVTTIDLDRLANWPATSASGVSANGAVVIGDIDGQLAFRYTAGGGLQPLILLAGWNTSSAKAVSANGSAIVGDAGLTSGHTHAFKYTDALGMQDLGTLGGDSSFAKAVSANGMVVVGSSDVGGDTHAFKHTDALGMQDLGTFAGGSFSSAVGVSADGKVTVGDAETAGGSIHAFKHTDGGSMVDLGTLTGGSYSNAVAVSANGATVIGHADDASGVFHAFKHTTGPLQDLGTMAGGTVSTATAVSADGAIVVGWGDSTAGFRAFKHTDSGGMVSLGTLENGVSVAAGISANGAVIYGQSDTASGTHAFRYTDSTGMVDLGTLGGNTSTATGISADGRVIVGYAETASGNTHAALWRSNVIVDVNNTVSALARTASQAWNVLDMRSAQLRMLMQQDCQVGVGRYCIGAGATYSGTGQARDTAANLVLGYGLTSQWRIGLNLSPSVDRSLLSSYKGSGSVPGIALFASYQTRKDGLGWQARVAAAYQKSRVDITREQMENTEAGSGRAHIKGKAVSVEGGYRFAVRDDVLIEPYAALRYSNVSRSAYSESNDIAFAASYAAMGRAATSIDAGMRMSKRVHDKLRLSADIGVTRDVSVDNRNFQVAMDYVGNFSRGSGQDERTRAYLGLQAGYALTADSGIRAGVFWSQQPYDNSTTSAQLMYVRQF